MNHKGMLLPELGRKRRQRLVAASLLMEIPPLEDCNNSVEYSFFRNKNTFISAGEKV